MLSRFAKEYALALIIVMSCMVIMGMTITYKTFVLCFIITAIYELRYYFNDDQDD